jgi:uncharacterized protein YjgD (DUF1641 family)
MTNEELILEKLENIESQIAPLLKTAKSVSELKEDIIPLSNQAVQLMINELQEVDANFEMDDMLMLMKQLLRNTKNFLFMFRQLNSIVDFVKDLEPLLKSSVPQMISYLDELEQKGVFRILKSMMEIRAKVAEAYSPEDIDQIGDGLVATLGLAKKISTPQAISFMEKAAEIPSRIDLSNAKKIGLFGLISAGCSSEVKEGLGVLIELTKVMGSLKDNGDIAGDKISEARPA